MYLRYAVISYSQRVHFSFARWTHFLPISVLCVWEVCCGGDEFAVVILYSMPAHPLTYHTVTVPHTVRATRG